MMFDIIDATDALYMRKTYFSTSALRAHLPKVTERGVGGMRGDEGDSRRQCDLQGSRTHPALNSSR